jgi:hypothetical protein
MPQLHILSNERVEKLARITQVHPRALGNWRIYWTSPEVSQDEVERLQRAAAQVLGADKLREGAYATSPSEVRETLDALLAGNAVPRPPARPAVPAPMPFWLEQVTGRTG